MYEKYAKVIKKLQEKAKNCGTKTKEDRARKDGYVDSIIEIKEALEISGSMDENKELQIFKQDEVLLLDGQIKVNVITPESNVLVKDSRDGLLKWVQNNRLKRI